LLLWVCVKLKDASWTNQNGLYWNTIELLLFYGSVLGKYSPITSLKKFYKLWSNMLSSHCTSASKYLQYRKRNNLTLIKWVGLFQNFAFCRFFNPSFINYCGFSSPLNNSILGFFEKIFKFGGLSSNSFIFISSFDLLSYYLPG
jgi:hypothetical protein